MFSSLEYSPLSQPEICSGNHYSIRLPAARLRTVRSNESKHALGRIAVCQARRSASLAQKPSRPPDPPISRHTMEGARPS